MRIDFSNLPKEIENFPWLEVLDQGEYWMDRYGEKHPIVGMPTDYIRNALPFAMRACRRIADLAWGSLVFIRGEQATMDIERIAMRYDEYDVPLVEALEAELRKRGEDYAHNT